MRWTLSNGKSVYRNDKKYLIDWNAPSRSKEQTIVKEFLKTVWAGDIVYEELSIPGSKLRVDFINATKKIALEHQGKGAHDVFNKFFHNNSRAKYLASIKRDVKKMQLLEANGFTFLETYTEDLDKLSKEFFLEKYNLNI